MIEEKKQLTRADFENRQKFKFHSDGNMGVFEYGKGNNSGYLSKYVDSTLSMYFCNVSTISDTFFTYYFFLFGKEVKGKVLFSDCLKCEVK